MPPEMFMKNPGRHQKSVMRKLFDLKQKPPKFWRLFLYNGNVLC